MTSMEAKVETMLTQKIIAQKLGLDQSTVSRALKNDRRVHSETKKELFKKSSEWVIKAIPRSPRFAGIAIS